MTADYAGLEARVAELEHQMRNVLPYRVDAIAYAVSLVHTDTQAIRDHLEHQAERQRQQSEHLDSIDRRLDSQAAALTDHGHLLAEILRRLPADPE